MNDHPSENSSASEPSHEQGLTSLDSLRPNACCGLFRGARLNCQTIRRCGIALLGIVAVTATCAAVYFAGAASQASNNAINNSADSGVTWAGMPIANATAAVTSEKFSMCTGPMSDQSEALFVLDHNSGLLQCSVLYPRIGRFMATYSINVADALGMEAKGSGYMMVTGTADFPSSSSQPLGFSVVYVLDTTSGNYACYGIPFNRVAMKSNQPQQGVLFLISQGTANPLVSRDELR